MWRKIITAFWICSVVFAGVVYAQDNDVKEIVKKIDELYRSKTSYAEIEMKIVTPHWERTLSMTAWSAGTKKTFIRILEPKKEKGVATLRIGNEMWNYLPKVNKVIKIPPSMMMSSWMGSDFTNDDLVKESSMLEDYHYKLTSVENPEKDIIYIELTPLENKPIVWGKIVMAVKENSYIPVWEKYYDEKGTLMRIMEFGNVTSFSNRQIPATLKMVPKNKENHMTVIEYKKLELDIPVGEDVFSLRNLRKR
ncbi:MAG: outer membrane lipoprotein-sorting protein [Elusimicrobia bacterium]|nr:outer membrane lipoprotein-sorting protein [Elusimicrobiota bacterium]